MLWISDNKRWDFAINARQWMVGFNRWEHGWNVFFACARLGYNSYAWPRRQ